MIKSQCVLASENPGGLDKIDNPHNFSSNPGFMSTQSMLGASTPADGGVIRGSSARGSLHPSRLPFGPSRAVTPASGR